jgi:hypothetical protein
MLWLVFRNHDVSVKAIGDVYLFNKYGIVHDYRIHSALSDELTVLSQHYGNVDDKLLAYRNQCFSSQRNSDVHCDGRHLQNLRPILIHDFFGIHAHEALF